MLLDIFLEYFVDNGCVLLLLKRYSHFVQVLVLYPFFAIFFHNNVDISPWQELIFKIYTISYTQYKYTKNKQAYFLKKVLGFGEVKS